MTPEQMRRALFGYDREVDLADGPIVMWNGLRAQRSDAPSSHRRGYSLNPGVALSEMAQRARLPYGSLGLPEAVTDEERRYGMPSGTGFAQSAARSRRSTGSEEGR